MVLVIVFPFSFLLLLWVLSFVLGEPGQRFVNVYSFKEQALGFINSFS